MKKIGILVISLAILFVLVSRGQTKTEKYYSGDAVYYNNQIVIISPDSGSLDVFAEKNNNIIRVAKFRASNDSLGQRSSFSDAVLNIENNHLYAYLVANYSVFKYDLSDPAHPTLVKKVRNTYWEWYTGVRVNNGFIETISKKKINILNTDLQNINSYALSNKNAYNISIDNLDLLFANNSDNHIDLYDRANRSISKSWVVNYKKDNAISNHRLYLDTLHNAVFVIDDHFVKKFDLNGNLKAYFKHLNYDGYDIVPSNDSRYVYASNGIGVMKFNSQDLSLVAYKFTSSLVSPGAWAMGIKAVWTPQGEKLVVFNNSNILILDQNLKINSYLVASEHFNDNAVSENLFLNIDRNSGAAGAIIGLNGGGFAANETLKVSFLDSIIEVQTNNLGRFYLNLTVPVVGPQRTAINVVGQNSGQHYQIAFEVK